MALFKVKHGLVYRAKLHLHFLETFASDEEVAQKFEELGFVDVVVTGEGETRYAQGKWNGPDEAVPLTDDHVVSVHEVKAPAAALHHKPGGPFSPLGHEETDDNISGGG